MAGKSKRTTAPTPLEFPWPTAQPVPPPTAQPVLPPTPQPVLPPSVPSMFLPGNWFPPRPPQSMAASTPPCWFAGVNQPSIDGSSVQGPWWAPPAGVGVPAQPTPTAENREDSDLQAWGLESHPPGDFLSFLKNTPSLRALQQKITRSQSC